MNENAKGSGFLKVCGILMIIGGSIALIVSIIAVTSIAAVAALAAIAGAEVNTGLLTFAAILSLVGGVAELVAGIIGVKNANKPENASKCMVWGIIVAVLSVLGCVLTAAGGNAFPVFNLILGLVLPVLFIIGALKNKNA